MARIYASWINSIIDSYNSTLGLNLPHATQGQKVSAAFFNSIDHQV